MYAKDDKELRDIIDMLIEACNKRKMALVVNMIHTTDIQQDDGQLEVHYSTSGNLAVAQHHYLTLMADYAAECQRLLPEESWHHLMSQVSGILVNVANETLAEKERERQENQLAH